MSFQESPRAADEEEAFYIQCRAAYLAVFRSSLTNIASRQQLCRGKLIKLFCAVFSLLTFANLNIYLFSRNYYDGSWWLIGHQKLLYYWLSNKQKIIIIRRSPFYWSLIQNLCTIVQKVSADDIKLWCSNLQFKKILLAFVCSNSL